MDQWTKNREKNRQASNDNVKRDLRYRRGGRGGGGHGSGPHRDTCLANQKLLKVLAGVPIGAVGNVIWAGMNPRCIAWYWHRDSVS